MKNARIIYIYIIKPIKSTGLGSKLGLRAFICAAEKVQNNLSEDVKNIDNTMNFKMPQFFLFGDLYDLYFSYYALIMHDNTQYLYYVK